MYKSNISHANLELNSRLKKSKKIISILKNSVDITKCDVLDIGVGAGYITNSISKEAKSVIGIDLYDERREKNGYKFRKVKSKKLPFKSHSFDIVISNQVIEHVPYQDLHISEIYRVLKKSGILYLATPNKYWITDPHHKLPFISWFPRTISTLYLKKIKNKKWDIYPLSYNQLKQLIKGKFEIKNMTIELLKHPQKYNLDIFKSVQPILRLIPISIIKLLNPFLPSYILILKKYDK